MYSPERFETLASAYHRVGLTAAKWSLTQTPIEGPIVGLWHKDETQGEYARWEAFCEWLWCRFAQHTAGHLFVTSPQGVPLKLDVFSSNFWGPASPDFPEDLNEQAVLAKRQGDIYYYIRPGSFTIDPNHSPPRLNDQQTELHLTPLDGWPVCWKPRVGQFSDAGFEAMLLAENLSDIAKMPSVPTQKPGPGHPKLRDGIIEEVVVNWFLDLHKKGELLGKKPETLVQEAIVFVDRAFKDKISRSTMQRYLQPVNAKLDAHK